MSAIGGKKRETPNFDNVKRVGLFEGKVIAVNPSVEDYKNILGIELKDDSKATNYTGVNEAKNKTLRIDFWLEETKTKEKFKAVFFLEDKEKENKEGTKKQYINNVGICSWADDPNNLPEWFSKREYRVAFVGEEELYGFMRTWLANLDYRDADAVLQLDWKNLIKGNVKDIASQIDGEYAANVLALATVKTVEKDGETKEYQGVYNKGFLPPYAMRQFRLIDYHNKEVVAALKQKKSKDLKPIERFVLNVTGEYGCKDFYVFRELREYNPSDNIVSTDAVISEDDGSY